MSGVILTEMALSFCMIADVRLVMTLWLGPPRGRHIFSTEQSSSRWEPASFQNLLPDFLSSCVQATGVMSSREEKGWARAPRWRRHRGHARPRSCRAGPSRGGGGAGRGVPRGGAAGKGGRGTGHREGSCQRLRLTASLVRLTAALRQGEFFQKGTHSHAAQTSAT